MYQYILLHLLSIINILSANERKFELIYVKFKCKTETVRSISVLPVLEVKEGKKNKKIIDLRPEDFEEIKQDMLQSCNYLQEVHNSDSTQATRLIIRMLLAYNDDTISFRKPSNNKSKKIIHKFWKKLYKSPEYEKEERTFSDWFFSHGLFSPTMDHKFYFSNGNIKLNLNF